MLVAHYTPAYATSTHWLASRPVFERNVIPWARRVDLGPKGAARALSFSHLRPRIHAVRLLTNTQPESRVTRRLK
jgi:hypothetical protein